MAARDFFFWSIVDDDQPPKFTRYPKAGGILASGVWPSGVTSIQVVKMHPTIKKSAQLISENCFPGYFVDPESWEEFGRFCVNAITLQDLGGHRMGIKVSELLRSA